MTPELIVVADPGAAADAAAALLVEAVRAGAAVGLSGGSTPRVAFARAAELEGDWGGGTLWLVDERCVLPDDPRANTRLVRETILDAVLVPPTFQEIATHLGVEAAADRYDALLREEGVPPLVFLGIGSDGHTASLFPGMPALAETDRLAVATDAGMEPFVPRITMTFDAIGAAEHVVFLVTGADKAERVRQAFVDEPSAAIPSSLARSVSGRTTAILDEAAAARL